MLDLPLPVRVLVRLARLEPPQPPSPEPAEHPVPGLPVSLPGWLRWILQHAKYVVPILIAFGLAQAEIKRRRKQDELRAERAAQRDEEPER